MSSSSDQFEFKKERIYKLFLEELVSVIYDLFVGLLQRVCGMQLIYNQTTNLLSRS